MVRGIERLKALTISRKMARGYYADGGGLYLQVSASGAKSWVFRFRVRTEQPDAGRLREMGLGSYNALTLAEARDAARDCRRSLQNYQDPITARSKERSAALAELEQAMTFTQCADAYIAAHEPSWHNRKHGKQWKSTLASYAYPVIGETLVREVDTRLIMKVLDPIWHTKRETASRVRGRIEAILDWATVRGYREGDNPARWKGKIDMLLPGRSRATKVKHHPALPYTEIPAFMLRLRSQLGNAAMALEFAILTAARTNEVLGASWSEIDFVSRTWTIPEPRMKSGREHRVPLSQNAMILLRKVKETSIGEFLFANPQSQRPLSNMAMLSVLKRMGRQDLTTHGFRSSFRDWVSERTDAQREVAEMALSHSIGNSVEAAYRRGDLYEKRRILMAAWDKYCTHPANSVTALKSGSMQP